jgi:hypothetical protein
MLSFDFGSGVCRRWPPGTAGTHPCLEWLHPWEARVSTGFAKALGNDKSLTERLKTRYDLRVAIYDCSEQIAETLGYDRVKSSPSGSRRRAGMCQAS